MTRPALPTRLFAVIGLSLTVGLATACGDDDDGPADQSPASTLEPLDSTGGPGGTVLNNQPTSPAANNAPPGEDGTG